MKSATWFLVSVLIFLFTAPSLTTSIVAAYDDLVLDYKGNPLEKGVGYILGLPGSRARGGTVTLTSPAVQNNETCEADVILVRVIPIRGTPFTFTPVNGSVDAITLRSPLAIQSPTRNPCGDSTVWKISRREGVPAPIIITGGIINTRQSCFRIIRRPNTSTQYAFEHCSGTCGPSREARICWPVGTTRSESGEYLSIGRSRLWFHFYRNSENAAKQDAVSF